MSVFFGAQLFDPRYLHDLLVVRGIGDGPRPVAVWEPDHQLLAARPIPRHDDVRLQLVRQSEDVLAVARANLAFRRPKSLMTDLELEHAFFLAALSDDRRRRWRDVVGKWPRLSSRIKDMAA